MKHHSLMALGALTLMLLPLKASAQQGPVPCQFIRDFKRLHDQAPQQVGSCTSRRVFAANGDVLQYTTNGLIVRRKSDNWTAFTDGRITYIDGPQGLASRSNDDRFPWEREPSASAAGQNFPQPVPRLGPASSYPKSGLTPGATDPRVTQRNVKRTICASGYTAEAAPSAAYAMRVLNRQMARYHYADTDPAHYQLDHYIPIELGGDPDAPSNMWPQPLDPAPGAREKDRAEAYLHDQVCSGKMTLAEAQQAILNDWVAVYQQLPPEMAEA